MKQKALFLCTGNSCRSQMAEGLLRHMAGDRFEVFSAGLHPAPVHPLSIKAMLEIGIDISLQRSKSVQEFLQRRFDIVVTVCHNARETCPIFPGKYKKFHWDLEDPAQVEGDEEKRMDFFRNIRDQIQENIARDFIPA